MSLIAVTSSGSCGPPSFLIMYLIFYIMYNVFNLLHKEVAFDNVFNLLHNNNDNVFNLLHKEVAFGFFQFETALLNS